MALKARLARWIQQRLLNPAIHLHWHGLSAAFSFQRRGFAAAMHWRRESGAAES
jgi:hypothetical protein